MGQAQTIPEAATEEQNTDRVGGDVLSAVESVDEANKAQVLAVSPLPQNFDSMGNIPIESPPLA